MFKKTIAATAIITVLFSTFSAAQTIVTEAKAVSTATIGSGYETASVDDSKVKIQKEEAKKLALEILKDKFDLEINEKEYQTSLNLMQNFGWRNSWEFSWHKYDNVKSVNIDLQLSAENGALLSYFYHEYNHDSENSVLASITKDEAKKIADDALEKLNPDQYKELEYEDIDYNKYYGGNYIPTDYSFRYIRKVNDIEYSSDSVNLEINGSTGKVSSYYYNWSDNVTFEDPEGIISSEAALEILKKNNFLQLQYVPVTNPYTYSENPSEIKLVYAQDYTVPNLINAKAGEPASYSGDSVPEPKVKDLTAQEKASVLASLKSPSYGKTEMDIDKATEEINRILDELFDESLVVENISYISNENFRGGYEVNSWQASFYPSGSSRFYGDITINAVTGEILNLYGPYDYYTEEEFEPKIDWDGAYDKAIDLITKFYPDRFDEIQTEQTYYESKHYVNGKEIMNSSYYFTFPRIINGIPYNHNSISINIDARTGNIGSIYTNWGDLANLPDLNDKISPEEAEKLFLTKNEPKLFYMSSGSTEDAQEPVKATLAYSLSSVNGYMPTFIDAKSGKFLDYNGQELVEDKTSDSFSDIINGHWAEKELGILAYQGIIDSGTFQLDQDITFEELIRILVKAKGNDYYRAQENEALKFTNVDKDSELYTILQMAVTYNLIENTEGEFNGSRNITREELAGFIVKLLNYDNLADKSEIFKLDFEDISSISPDKTGYIAICNAFGILNGDTNNLIRPKDNATSVETAIAVYRALSSMKK